MESGMIKNILNIDTFRGITTVPQLSSSLTEFSARLHTMLNQIISEVSTIQTGNAIYGSTIRTTSSDVIIPPTNPYLLPASRVRDGYLAATDFVIFDDKVGVPVNATGNAKWFHSTFDNVYTWEDLPLTGQNHAGLTNLDYASAGHTGFEPALGFTPLNSTHSSTPGAWDHSLFAVGTDVHSIPAGGDALQVLAKIDGTDYNVGWVDALGTLSPLTTKGDIFTYSTLNVRLGVGTNGQVLTAASGETTGLKWVTPTVYTSPVTTKGDLFTFSTVEAKLGVGTDGYVLTAKSSTTTGLDWVSLSSLSSMIPYSMTGTGNILVGGVLTFHDNYNACLGVGAFNATGGYNEVAVGYQALYGDYYGHDNTVLGYRAAYALGSSSGGASTDCVAIGSGAMGANTTGFHSIAIGTGALNSTTGAYNIGIGTGVGAGITSGASNTILGTYALANVTTGSNNLALGYCAGRYATGSNELYVDVFNRTNTAGDKAGALLYGGFNSTVKDQFLHVNGVFYPIQATTAACPTYVLGGVYFDTTLNKLRIGGAAGWETVTSV